MTKPLPEDEEFLSHYGVKGQKWGVRKRRNEAARKKQFSPANRARKMSEKDLKEAIARMELEKKYIDLSKGTTGAGKKYTRDILENSGKTAVGAAVGGVSAHVVKKILTKS